MDVDDYWYSKAMVDIMIVGQGLVGSLVALECIRKGRSVVVIDNPHESSATKVAAGIMNPLVGPRLSPLWKGAQRYDDIKAYYRGLEKMMGIACLNEHRLVRCLNTEIELESYEKRIKDPEISSIMKETGDWTPICESGKVQFEIPGVGQLDTKSFLAGAKKTIRNHGELIEDHMKVDDIQGKASGIHWKGIVAKHLVFCEGAKGERNPFFPDCKFKNARGHIVAFCMSGMPKNTILNHGKWCCPKGGSNGAFLYGASTFWEDSLEQNKASEINIKASLAQFLKVPVKIESIAFGIRPCLIQQRPFAGWSNREPSIGMINGFGGQGVFLAPTVVQSFCRQI